jgi:hypothetical protein
VPGRIDPELRRRLDAAGKAGEPARVVVQINRAAGRAIEPAESEARIHAALERTSAATGEQPDDVHVLGRMAVAYVSGSETFVRELIEQPEVTGAVANETPGGSAAE